MSTTTVNARIDTNTKNQAVSILKSLGLSTTQAISLYFRQIVYTKGLPFDVKLPNRQSLQAISELASGRGKNFDSVDELFEELEH